MDSPTKLADSKLYADFDGLQKLKAAARERSPEAAREVARQFEAIFIQMMLKSMRDTGVGDQLFDSEELGFYREMFDKQIATEIAGRGEFGIADALLSQLDGVSGPVDAQLTFAPTNFVGEPEDPFMGQQVREIPIHAPTMGEPLETEITPVGRHTPKTTLGPLVNVSPATFVQSLRPYAEQAAGRLGVTPDILVAQAALETGWGARVIRRADGSSSNNLFAIKAGNGWDGARATVSTLEYEDGVARKRIDAFRAYSSLEQAFDDFVELLQTGERYQQALRNAADPRAFVTELQAAGYATDPAYAQKILDIYSRAEFAESHSTITAALESN